MPNDERHYGGFVMFAARNVVFASLVLLLLPAAALARVDGEAVPGRPFGLGRVTIPRADLRGKIDEQAIQITERDGRIHYPAFRYGRFGALIGEVVGVGDGSPGNVTIYFLFTGDEPLRVTVSAPEAISFELVPRVGRPRENDR